MDLLLDTQAFIWWVNSSYLLPNRVLNACQDPATTLFVSVASVWEMQVKIQLGKLRVDPPLPGSLADIVTTQQANGVRMLPIELPHVLALDRLPLHHRDPFDRIIIAQALVEDFFLASSDRVFDQYPVKLFW